VGFKLEIPRDRKPVYELSWDAAEGRFVERTTNFGKYELISGRIIIGRFPQLAQVKAHRRAFFALSMAEMARKRLKMGVFHIDQSDNLTNETQFITNNSIVDILHHETTDEGMIHVYNRDSGKPVKTRKPILLLHSQPDRPLKADQVHISLWQTDADGHVRAYKALQDVLDYLSMRPDTNFSMLRNRMMAGLRFSQARLLAHVTPQMRREIRERLKPVPERQ
jgi:hypothetical protein